MDQQQLQQRLLHEDEQFNLKKELFKYLRFWPWFVVSIIICVSIAFIYLKRTPFIFSSVTKVKVLDEKDGLEGRAGRGIAYVIKSLFFCQKN